MIGAIFTIAAVIVAFFLGLFIGLALDSIKATSDNG